jgi:hypothetical protein
MQRGVKPQNVIVAYDEKFYEQKDLIMLFNFTAIKISSVFSYSKLVAESFKKIFEYPLLKVKFFIKILQKCFLFNI